MNKKYAYDEARAFTGTDDTSIPVITEEDLRMAMDAAKQEWDTVDAMMHGNFTPDSEQEYVKKQYQDKLKHFQEEYRAAQNRADESRMHYLSERIKEVTEKIKALDAAPNARYQELLKKRDEAEKKAHAAKTKEEQDKWIKLMWKYNDELKWLGPEVTSPTKGPAPDGSGESWLPRRR